MILGFCLIIYGGPLALMITVICVHIRDACICVITNRLFSLDVIRFFCCADTAGASEMFRGNHFDWLPSLSHSRFAMVPKPFVVLFAYVQLLFLWGKLGGLLWCGDKSSGISQLFDHLSSIFVIHIVLHWIRLVCVVARQKILYEAVQFVCLDTCCIADCRHTKLFNHSEYI